MMARGRRGAGSGQRISLITVAVSLALTATVLGSLLALGIALYDRSVADARNMAVALQQYALRTVTTGQIAAETIAERVRARGGLNDIEDDRTTHDLLAEMSARLPDGSGIILVDPAGKVVSNYAEFPATPIDLSDRAWFLEHVAGTDFIMTEALLSRVSKRKMFIMTQAVRRNDKSLIGIVNLGLPSDALIGEQALPESGSGTVLTLMKRDGGLLARSDFPDSLLGTTFALPDDAEDAVSTTLSRDIDGRAAIEATDSEPSYGLVVRASIPLTQVFRPLMVLSAISLPLIIALMVVVAKLIRSLAEQHKRLEQTTARLRVVIEASHLGTWHLYVPTGASEMNERWARIVGHDPGEIAQDSMEWVSRLHPEERDTVLKALNDMLEGKTDLMHIEHRLRHKDGHWVWVLDSGCIVERDTAGKPLVATGTLLDISERRETEGRIRMLMGEVDHRAKNLLAVVQSLVNLMPADDLPKFKATLLGRIKALGHVHTLLSETGWSGVDLDRLIVSETAPYRTDSAPFVASSGAPLMLKPASAQAFAMIVHELMTNSAKYGALSSPTGHVAIDWTVSSEPGGSLQLQWCESGGPAVRKPTRDGFGSKLLTTLVQGQLEGRIDTQWPESGAIIAITVPLASVVPRRDERFVLTNDRA